MIINMNTKNNVAFMAFAKGKETTDVVVKRYVGVAPVFVKAVNPTKDELETLYNRALEDTPNYISDTEIEVNGSKKQCKQVRLDFIVVTDSEKCNGISMMSKISFFLTNSVKYNKDYTKVQVINKYGETTWLSVEDAKAKRIPESLSWFEPADFRPAFIGEEELTGFIKAYLNIPNKSYRNKDGDVIELKDKSEAEARLDCISDYFKGNFNELREILTLQPKNKVKCLFGVKTVNDKQYQDVYTKKFLKNSVSDYSKLKEDVEDRKSAGSYPNTEFVVDTLREYSVEATDMNSLPKTSMPSEDLPEAFPSWD